MEMISSSSSSSMMRPFLTIVFSFSGLTFFLCGWQDDNEQGSFARGAGGINGPLVLLDQAAADGKPQPGPFAFGGEKRVENVIQGCRRHSGAIVFDLDPDFVLVFEKSGSGHDLPWSLNCFGGIEIKIQKDLLQLRRIDLYLWLRGVKVAAEIDDAGRRFGGSDFDILDGVVKQAIEVRYLQLRLGWPGKFEQVAQQTFHSLDFGNNPFKQVAIIRFQNKISR